MTANPYVPTMLAIDRAVHEIDGVVTFTLTPPGGFAFAPGQFNMLYVHGVGEVAISISGDPAEPAHLVHTVRSVGTVTRAMTALDLGSVLGVRGPYGSAWPVDAMRGRDVLVIAGGLGLAPLRPAILHLLAHRSSYGRVTICPVAYQMSACHAIEDALGVRVDGPLRALRRLLYCGEWIESHVLHMVMLHAPDFLGLPDSIALAAAHPERVRGALAIKKAGNAIVATLGGREIHPVNVRVGGFYRAPRTGELAALLPDLRAALDEAELLLDWLAGFTFPELSRDYELVALRHPGEYPMNEGRLVSTRGLDITAREFGDHIREEQVEYTTALHARILARGAYLTGPLARFALNADRLSPRAAAAAARVGLDPGCRNPFRLLLVRGVEVIHALDEAIRLIEAYAPPPAPAVPVAMRAGTGHAITCAPRGILYHRYVVGDDGLVTDAQITPPTSQNQRSIEDDLLAMGPMLAALPHDVATRRAEHAIRNHDPCISCSTHFLTLAFEHR